MCEHLYFFSKELFFMSKEKLITDNFYFFINLAA
jgi:hypothetical protein